MMKINSIFLLHTQVFQLQIFNYTQHKQIGKHFI